MDPTQLPYPAGHRDRAETMTGTDRALDALARKTRQLGPDEARRFAAAVIDHGHALIDHDGHRRRGEVYLALGRVVAGIAADQVATLAALSREIERERHRDR